MKRRAASKHYRKQKATLDSRLRALWKKVKRRAKKRRQLHMLEGLQFADPKDW